MGAGATRKMSRPIFEFSAFREHAVPALDWQGCMQVREAATDAEVLQRLSYIVYILAAEVPTRSGGGTGGGDDRGVFNGTSPETPHTVSKRT
jgi:hypothetical protein